MAAEITHEEMAQHGPTFTEHVVTFDEALATKVGSQYPEGGDTIVKKATWERTSLTTCANKGDKCSTCAQYGWKTSKGCEITL